ncbi:MAG: RagB/SusD family nutrient uptake outer membrane protein [Rikenellaceae bacterium]
MKMKMNIKYSIVLLVALCACELDKYPTTIYNENNVTTSSDSDSAITTREDILGQLEAMYSYMSGDMQNYWYRLIVISDVRSDNAYGGNMSEAKVVAVESNRIDSDNDIAYALWNYSMNAIDKANQIICYIDTVKANDSSLTTTEYNEWLSEALVWRAYIWINMIYLFGDIPMVTEIPPAITSANIEEVYHLYFPERVSPDLVGAQIIADVENFACDNAPAVESDKFKITKGFAHGVMARFYAMPHFRNWSKVIEHCEAVEALDYTLTTNYGDMWSYDDTMAEQDTTESIFEVSWSSQTSGSWLWMMFYRNAFSPSDGFDWAKWCTPSRLLTSAYDKEGDTERKEASVVYDETRWSFHYPSNNYAFMHKLPTNVTPIYIMRLADIKLLHAEALANSGSASDAIEIVNYIRSRAKIATLDTNMDATAAREAVLHERRLELAFEGHRWFDLLRYDDDYSTLISVCDAVNAADSYYQTRKAMTERTALMPIPTTVLDNNTNIEQNLGY